MGGFFARLGKKTRPLENERMFLVLDPLIDQWLSENAIGDTLSPQLLERMPDTAPDGGTSINADISQYDTPFYTESEDVEASAADGEQIKDTTETHNEEFKPVLDNLDSLIDEEIIQLKPQSAIPARGSQGFETNASLIEFSSQPIDRMSEAAIEQLKLALVQRVKNIVSSYQHERISLADRHKRIDAKKTIRNLIQNGGVFTGLSYRQSPSLQEVPVALSEFLFIGDVSGSMGRYVATVMYLMVALSQLGKTIHYVFSDTPTRIEQSFATSIESQIKELKKQATSWEYGTRLSLALERVTRDAQFTNETTVLLVTDGGFNLTGDDWERTVRGLTSLRKMVGIIIVITPNAKLSDQASRCEERLWNVEKDPRPSHEIVVSADLIRVARFGLLARYSDHIVKCETAKDFETLILALTRLSPYMA